MTATEPQQNFGGFDARFLGITLYVGSDSAAKTLLALAAGEDARRFVDGVDLDSEEGFGALSLISVFAHELRHYHDFLLSPWGSRILRARLEALINIEQQLEIVSSPSTWERANALPVPVSRWARMDAPRRAQFMDSVNAHLTALGQPPAAFPDMPVIPAFVSLAGRTSYQTDFDDTTFAQYTEVIAGSYDKLRLLVVREDAPGRPSLFQAQHVAETSAVLIQMQELWRALGAEAVNAFSSALTEHTDRPYGLGLRTATEAFKRLGIVDTRLEWISALTTYAMLGDYRAGVAVASPVTRFAQVHHDMAENGWPQADSTAALFEHWDRNTGQPSTTAGVKAHLELDEQFVARLADVSSQLATLSPDSEVHRTIARIGRIFEAYVAQRRTVVDAFLNDAEAYTNPYRYLHELGPDLPKPAVRFVPLQGVLRVPSDDDPAYVHHPIRMPDGSRTACELGYPASPNDQEWLVDCFWLSDLITRGDVLYAEVGRNFTDAELSIARMGLGDARFFNVF
jgi:hypothetical protein